MDVFSHALWGYAILRWRGRREARWGALTGAAPDLLYFGASVIARIARGGLSSLYNRTARDPNIWRADGPPMPQTLIDDYWNYYVWTHSFVVLGMLAIAWFVFRRRAPWLLLPWALHILMDIPAHERYLTPFLYPLSTFTIAGYAWNRPPMLIANYGALALTYAWLFWRLRRSSRLANGSDGKPQPTEVGLANAEA